MRVWMAALGEEALHEADLPVCCQRAARGADDSFECLSCGASWREPLPVGTEECAFTEPREKREERKGAA